MLNEEGAMDFEAIGKAARLPNACWIQVWQSLVGAERCMRRV